MMRSLGKWVLYTLCAAVVVVVSFSILFPPWIDPRSKTVQCMTNLHDIAMAMKMYHEDYSLYPKTLAGNVQTGPDGIIPFERTNGHALYPEYTRKINTFHCPMSLVTDTSEVTEVKLKSRRLRYYAYDSYDAYAPPGSTKGSLRYTREWAATVDDVSEFAPYPPGTKDTLKLRKSDFKRQFKFPDPPDDTVITWCGYHTRRRSTDYMPVLFVDGHCDQIPASDVEGGDGKIGSRWRTRPKR